MSISKKQHYIPQFIIRNFADENGYIYYYDKNKPEKGICKTTNPGRLFYKKHIYSKKNNEGKKDVSLENEYSKLESNVSRLVEKIILSIKNYKNPNLSLEEKFTLDLFLYHQVKRVPEYHSKFFDSESIEEIINEVGLSLDLKKIPQDIQKQYFDLYRNDPEYIQELRVNVLASRSNIIDDFFQKSGLAIATIRNKQKSFILGSKPVAFLKYQQPNLIHENWLPLTPQIIISPVSENFGKELMIHSLQPEQIRLINKTIFNQSTIAASKSFELLNFLIKTTK